MASPYIERILKARVYDVAIEIAAGRSRRGCRAGSATSVLLKREDLQPVFSFKLRGAYNKIAHLPTTARAARRHLRIGRQSRAGRRARRAAAAASPPSS